MPAVYVKPYVKRQKNDATDAEAICEAVARPTMRLVAIKGEDQQAVLMMLRARQLLIRQRTMIVNALRGHIGELGMVSPPGNAEANQLIALVECKGDESIPAVARTALKPLVHQLQTIQQEVDHQQDAIRDWHRQSDLSQRLETIPGIGPITASALAATVTNPEVFTSGRQLAAWIWRNTFLKFTLWIRRTMSFFVRHCVGMLSRSSLPNCQPVLSGWKPVAGRITGQRCYQTLGMRYA